MGERIFADNSTMAINTNQKVARGVGALRADGLTEADEELGGKDEECVIKVCLQRVDKKIESQVGR